MVFGFLGRAMGFLAGILALAAMLVFATGFLREYTVLLASLTAYGTSTLVCVVMSLASRQERFDFATIGERVGDYDQAPLAPEQAPRRPAAPAAATLAGQR